LKYEEDISTKY
jgi:calcium-dependent protein kinase